MAQGPEANAEEAHRPPTPLRREFGRGEGRRAAAKKLWVLGRRSSGWMVALRGDKPQRDELQSDDRTEDNRPEHE